MGRGKSRKKPWQQEPSRGTRGGKNHAAESASGARGNNEAPAKSLWDKFDIGAKVALAAATTTVAVLLGTAEFRQREAHHEQDVAQRAEGNATISRDAQLRTAVEYIPHLTPDSADAREVAVRILKEAGSPDLARIAADYEPDLEAMRLTKVMLPEDPAARDTAFQRIEQELAEQQPVPVRTGIAGSRTTQGVVGMRIVPIRVDAASSKLDSSTKANSQSADTDWVGGGTEGLWKDRNGRYHCSGECTGQQACCARVIP